MHVNPEGQVAIAEIESGSKLLVVTLAIWIFTVPVFASSFLELQDANKSRVVKYDTNNLIVFIEPHFVGLNLVKSV